MNTEHIVWYKASYSSGNDACVEVSKTLLPKKKVPVRDSKNPGGPRLTFEVGAFAAFIGDVKGGAYDV